MTGWDERLALTGSLGQRAVQELLQELGGLALPKVAPSLTFTGLFDPPPTARFRLRLATKSQQLPKPWTR